MQYGGGQGYDSGVLKSVEYRPLLRHLYYNEGAIYWMREFALQSQTKSTHLGGDNGWDINYKTYDFDFMDGADTENGTSLSLIRLVDE